MTTNHVHSKGHTFPALSTLSLACRSQALGTCTLKSQLSDLCVLKHYVNGNTFLSRKVQDLLSEHQLQLLR